MWNKKYKRLELYFGDIQSISRALSAQNPLKKLNLGHFMVTVNEPKGLVAIYDTVKGLVSCNTKNDGYYYNLNN